MAKEQQGNQPHGTHEQGIGAGGVLMAFAIGAAVGAAAALLLTPTTGEETRRVMNERTRESRERILEALRQGRGLFNQRRRTIVTAFERARQQAQAAREKGQDA